MKKIFSLIVFLSCAVVLAGKPSWIPKGQDVYMLGSGNAYKKDGTAIGGSGGITGPGSSSVGGIPTFPDTSGGTLASSGMTISSDVIYASNGRPVSGDPTKLLIFNNDFCATSTSTFDIVSGSSGTTTADQQSDSAGNPCFWLQATGTTLKSYTTLRLSYIIPTGGAFWFESGLKLAALSDITDEYDYFIGIQNSATDAVSTDSITLRYDRNTSDNWIMQACNNTTCTNTTSSVSTSSKALVSTGYHRYGFATNAAWTSTTFYVDGEAIGTVAANHPAAGRIIRPVLKIVGNAGTTSRSVMLDYIDFRQVFTTAR